MSNVVTFPVPRVLVVSEEAPRILKARAGDARRPLPILKLVEDLATRARLRTNLVHEMQKVFAAIDNKTHAALFIAEVFEDVKKSRQVDGEPTVGSEEF
jgi:hypothetical protein